MTSPQDVRDEKQITAEAGQWFAARDMLDANEFDVEGFERWLEVHPAHGIAFDRIARAANAVGRIPLEEFPVSSAVVRPARWQWPVIGGALAAMAAAALAFVVLPGTSVPQAAYATEVARMDTQRLADGSVVTLGPASRIEVYFSDAERRVVLASGEAFFEVTHDESRPFFVEAGDARIRVVGTKFDVRRGGDVVRVSVAQGVVQVQSTPALALARPDPVVLRAGDAVQMPERVAPIVEAPRPELIRVSASSAGAWREGRLSYVEAPLSEIVADLNRYYAPGVRLADPELGRLILTASFEADQIAAFLASMPQGFPVEINQDASGAYLIESRP